MKCDQSNGYQQLVINSEPGSVDSTIDNLSIRQLSIANGNKLGRDAIASHWITRGATRFIVILFHISVILTVGNCQNPTGWNAGQIHTNKKNYAFFVRMFVFYRSLTFFSLKTGRNCPKKLLSL
jgi:hypothetical protein